MPDVLLPPYSVAAAIVLVLIYAISIVAAGIFVFQARQLWKLMRERLREREDA